MPNLLRFSENDLRFNADTEIVYTDFSEYFCNNNDIVMEIGAGKGKFAIELAKKNPNVNVIAVEKTAKVIIMACEEAAKDNIKNLLFINTNAGYLQRHIAPNSISRLYLNFSCPYPKNTYANHRLTNPAFLNMYKLFLKRDAEIHQKTDNMHFFEYSIEQFSYCGFLLKNINLDLHKYNIEDNIVTEYEQKYVDLGKPIYRLEAYIRNT